MCLRKYLCRFVYKIPLFTKMKIINAILKKHKIVLKQKKKCILYSVINSFQWQYLIGSICMHLIWGDHKGKICYRVSHLKAVLLPLCGWLHGYLHWLMHSYLGQSIMAREEGLDLLNIPSMIHSNVGSKDASWVTHHQRLTDRCLRICNLHLKSEENNRLLNSVKIIEKY